MTFAAVARDVVAAGGRVLVLAHRSELLDQAARTLRGFGLAVAIERGEDRIDHADLPDVVVASVQSLQRSRLAKIAPDTFALIVVDEAHHATAKSYRAVLDHFATAKVLGVTATPDRADGVGLRAVFDSVAYRMELGAGIRGGFLAPIELRSVVVDSLDLSRVHTQAGDLHAGELEAELMHDGVLHEIAGPLAELAAGRQTLAFVVGVAQAHALAEVLTGYGVRAAAVDGSMSPEARADVLDAYRSGRLQLVTNAMLWTEGFDAPETACVALVRPTRSRALVTQMIGRGTRFAEGKGSCLVLDFVPGRMARVRLASPADALAGDELPPDLAARVLSATSTGAEPLDVLLERVRAEAAAAEAANIERERAERAEHQRRIRSVGVFYEAPRLDINDLLDAVTDAAGGGDTSNPASLKQVLTLRAAGLEVPDAISKHAASALFNVLEKRRAAGLCTIKQARRLRSYGLHDNVSFADASQALDAIASNGWRPPPALRNDARFR
ncbi:MAG TPA: DEAD/DEAH box helicase, partial [Polyangiales bacterium]|nr:DEAD/DEAH box helicase [Polyangiales bacterium]